jgi:hypothetical protein
LARVILKLVLERQTLGKKGATPRIIVPTRRANQDTRHCRFNKVS